MLMLTVLATIAAAAHGARAAPPALAETWVPAHPTVRIATPATPRVWLVTPATTCSGLGDSAEWSFVRNLLALSIAYASDGALVISSTATNIAFFDRFRDLPDGPSGDAGFEAAEGLERATDSIGDSGHATDTAQVFAQAQEVANTLLPNVEKACLTAPDRRVADVVDDTLHAAGY
ncbi:MAG: hypothetical protein KGL52_04730 [Rhodospirillales bacterium]|nr:hypothetical protein [Rhodospirillales bacterium]